jgi:hypothetical protein
MSPARSPMFIPSGPSEPRPMTWPSQGLIVGMTFVAVGGFHAFLPHETLDAMIRGYGLTPGPVGHALRRVLGWFGLIIGTIVLIFHFAI